MNSEYNLSYIDYLLSFIAVIFVIFMSVIIQVKQETAQGNVKDKSEFLIEMVWEDDSPDDVDLWVQNPLGNIAYYKAPDIGMMTLDRDDKGIIDNSIVSERGQTFKNPIRREVMSIRAIIPGTYTVNSFMFAKRDMNAPTKVTITVRKLNPYSEIYEGTKVLKEKSEELTFLQFTIDDSGNLSMVNKDNQISLFAELSKQ